MMFSGSHRQSLRELQQENADIAAIDCVTYALLQRHQPQALAGRWRSAGARPRRGCR